MLCFIPDTDIQSSTIKIHYKNKKKDYIFKTVRGTIASILWVDFKYFAFKEQFYSKIIQSSSILTHFGLNIKKCALCTSSSPNNV